MSYFRRYAFVFALESAQLCRVVDQNRLPQGGVLAPNGHLVHQPTVVDLKSWGDLGWFAAGHLRRMLPVCSPLSASRIRLYAEPKQPRRL
jgi:hypothetical protein